MVKKLLSFLTATTGWRLFGKALVGLLALLLAGLLGFSFWGVLILFIAAAWLYFSETVERTRRRGYFFLLTLWAWTAGAATFGLAFYAVAALYAALLYVWLGDVRLLWADRRTAVGVGKTGLFAAWAVILFYLFPPALVVSFWGALGLILAFFIVSVTLVREGLRTEPEWFARRGRLVAWAAGLVLAETAVLTVFLPLGFLNAAAVLTLVFIVLRDVVSAHFGGRLKTGLVFREITVLAVFLVIIFAVVPWALQ